MGRRPFYAVVVLILVAVGFAINIRDAVKPGHEDWCKKYQDLKDGKYQIHLDPASKAFHRRASHIKLECSLTHLFGSDPEPAGSAS